MNNYQDNFRDVGMSQLHDGIRKQLGDFWNRPYIGMSMENSRDVLEDILKLAIKLNK